MGASLGSMGQSYSGKMGRNIENMSRPTGDPTDIASQQQLMQWQNGMGRTEEARNTQIGINNMQAQQAKQQKAAAEGKVANLTASMQQIEKNPIMTREHKNQTLAMLQEELTSLSSVVGRNLGNTLTQIQGAAAQEQRQVDNAQRARERHAFDQDVKARAELDKTATAEFYKLPVTERETYIQGLREKDNDALASKLETRTRQDVRWAEEREEQAKKTSANSLSVITPGEKTVLDTELASLESLNKEAADAFRAKLAAIESDTTLSTAMRRQQVNKQYEAISRIVTNQTSAAMTSARTAAKEVNKNTELKNPPLGLYRTTRPDQPAPAMQAVDDAKSASSTAVGEWFRSWDWTNGPTENQKAADKLAAWIDTVGDEAAARLAAAIVTTYPQTTLHQALLMASEANMGVGAQAGMSAGAPPAGAPPAGAPPAGAAGSSVDNPIEL
jgi:hypothetical protein